MRLCIYSLPKFIASIFEISELVLVIRMEWCLSLCLAIAHVVQHLPWFESQHLLYQLFAGNLSSGFGSLLAWPVIG